MRTGTLTSPKVIDPVQSARGAIAQASGYGSPAASPPVTVFQLPLPHFGHGGRCFVEPTSIVSPHWVHEYVPALTSLPAGTGSAMCPPSYNGEEPRNGTGATRGTGRSRLST